MKKTNYKKLWRKVKKQNILMANEITRLNGIAKVQSEMIGKIRDGKINPKEIVKAKKVLPDAQMQKIIDEAKKSSLLERGKG